ncbi:O-antigen ligase [Arthrobacter sp. STN4]|uniref:O-antigen ligase family protein n=1 Tax=Arthrobacter sp. STN4 TaxID=2923276 RepID=UPI00211A081B|nr:hypothetical protein [Arthrobacter sp. STN4]MCQ9163652.1 hypothetical protein [Arthrobacter sp. STN4]
MIIVKWLLGLMPVAILCLMGGLHVGMGMATGLFVGQRGLYGRSRFLPASNTPRYVRGAAHLPAWPFTMLFIAFPLWWILGLSDFIWLAAGGVMLLYLIRFRAVHVPRGFGLWLLFLIWVSFSGIQIDSSGRLLGFMYRFLIYVSVTAIFLYVYNSMALTGRKVLGNLVLLWGFVIVGGYLGIFFPTAEIKTPLAHFLPPSMLQNELLNQMAVRRLTQYNPDAWFQIDPRPSAPFLYTNNWGAAFSLLLPFVAAYLWHVRGERKFWLVLAAVPVSIVPAVLTLNRGMFLGLGVALLYAGARFAMAGNKRGVGTVFAFGMVSLVIVQLLPVASRLQNRLSGSSSTADRGNLYSEAFTQTLSSPLLGFGAPRPSGTIGAPSVGTQGQFWMVLYSHGFVGAVLFTLTFFVLFLETLRRSNPLVLAANTVLLVSLVEIFYYGMLTTGLVLMFVAAAVALKGPPLGDGVGSAAKHRNGVLP